MDIIYLIIGIVIGVLIGFLSAKLFMKGKSNFPESQEIILEKSKLEERVSSLVRENENQLKEWNLYKAELQHQLEVERQSNNEARRNLTEISVINRTLEEKLLLQKNELVELQNKFKTEFENIANRLLEEKSQKFAEQNKTNLDIILNPLKEKIKDFETKVEKAYSNENNERILLKSEIKNLLELNKKISEEANNLASALKGNNKTQGNWGEMILEKILEISGLQKNIEYKTQYSATNEEGKRMQPDVVILLPDEKNLVIDSKVSLVAYEQFINADNDEDKQRYLKQHLDSIRLHIKGLSEKNYTELSGVKTPDFVLLFIPVEASFAAALQGDPEIYNFAWDRKIVLVSPTTLLATLRTVSSVWKQEKQVKNALSIAEEAGKMYDKFVMLTDDLVKVGKSIDDSKKVYADAMNKLIEGRGNLIKRAEDLKQLGIKTSKNFNPGLLERANGESNELNIEKSDEA